MRSSKISKVIRNDTMRNKHLLEKSQKLQWDIVTLELVRLWRVVAGK